MDEYNDDDWKLDFYCGDYGRVDLVTNKSRPEFWELTTRERNAELKKVKTNIKTLYDKGIPFFTKDAIRNVHRQLKDCIAQGQGKISVKGLDGNVVEFGVEIGQVYKFIKIPEPDLEYVSVKPFLGYKAMQHLLYYPRTDFFIEHLAYCNLPIYHSVALRNKFTHEFVRKQAVPPKNQVKKSFEEDLLEWTSSQQYAKLKSTLKVLRNRNIKKIIAFACGSFASDNERWRSRSSHQHGLIIASRESLVSEGTSAKDHGAVQCFAQEPDYTDADREVLQDYDITVLDDPEGWLEVDETSVVISCSPNVPVKQIVTDLARPACMIWDTIRDEDRENVTDPDSPRMRKLIEDHYQIIEFPKDEDHFGRLSIYLRTGDNAAR